MRAHAQTMNEYRRGEVSTEVVAIVDRNLWTEIVDRRRSEVSCDRDSMIHGPSSMPVPTLFYFIFIFFKMLFSYFVIQFNIKTFEKINDLISRLFNFIVH